MEAFSKITKFTQEVVVPVAKTVSKTVFVPVATFVQCKAVQAGAYLSEQARKSGDDLENTLLKIMSNVVEERKRQKGLRKSRSPRTSKKEVTVDKASENPPLPVASPNPVPTARVNIPKPRGNTKGIQKSTPRRRGGSTQKAPVSPKKTPRAAPTAKPRDQPKTTKTTAQKNAPDNKQERSAKSASTGNMHIVEIVTRFVGPPGAKDIEDGAFEVCWSDRTKTVEFFPNLIGKIPRTQAMKLWEEAQGSSKGPLATAAPRPFTLRLQDTQETTKNTLSEEDEETDVDEPTPPPPKTPPTPNAETSDEINLDDMDTLQDDPTRDTLSPTFVKPLGGCYF